MATCAVCQSPIVEPQRFVIDGTEVIHRACARSGRFTVLQRAQQDLATARHAEATAHRREIEHRSKIAILEGKVRAQETDLERVRRDHRVLLRQFGITRTERDGAVLERDAARSELALHQTLAMSRAATAAPESPLAAVEAKVVPEAEGELDPTEKRFSLLELD
jgi:hypothetical protein